MSSNFGLLGLLATELAALERLKKSPYAYNGKNDVSTFSRILFIFAGNDKIHESLDEFEIRLDQNTGFHGNRYGYDGKNGVSTFSRLFFI